jgi:hypothetical protein
MAVVGPLVCVSYAREAGPADARRLVSDLAQQLGPDRVFGVGQGIDSEPAIKQQIERSDVLLAVIGPGWLGSDDAFAGEIGLGLTRRVPVIPVLARRAGVPPRDTLSDGLKPLLDHHPGLTFEIPTDFLWSVSVAHLARWLIAIGDENVKRQKAKDEAGEKRRTLEQDVERAATRRTQSEQNQTEAEGKRAKLEVDVEQAAQELAERQKEVDPGRAGAAVRVFLSYRPETSGDARQLERDLNERLERGRVLATEPVPEGADPEVVISGRIAGCDVLLAIIGPDWLTAKDAEGRRCLENPKDPIRLEVEAGIGRGVPVIPVLTQHATQPVADALPDSLRPLSAQRAFALLVQFWSDGVNDIVARLKKIEEDLQRREKERSDAAAQHRKLERSASKAKEEEAKAQAAVSDAKSKLSDLEQKVLRAREEEDRLNAEHDDQNRAFLQGPGPIPVKPVPTGPGKPDLRRLLLIGAIVVIIVVAIILSASH